jgi:transposase-like protein
MAWIMALTRRAEQPALGLLRPTAHVEFPAYKAKPPPVAPDDGFLPTRSATCPRLTALKPSRADSSESGYTLIDFMREWPDDATCLEWLWRTRHSPDGENAYCSKSERDRQFKRYECATRRHSWNCTACGHHVYPTAGTIFEKSSTSLQLWFYAMYLMASTRCGISAKQLERELGVKYQTAWRMFNKIRKSPDGR